MGGGEKSPGREQVGGKGLPEDGLGSWGCRGPLTVAWQGPSRAPAPCSDPPRSHPKSTPTCGRDHGEQRVCQGRTAVTATSRTTSSSQVASPSTRGPRGEPRASAAPAGHPALGSAQQRSLRAVREPDQRLFFPQSRGLTRRTQTPDAGAGEIQLCTKKVRQLDHLLCAVLLN